MNNSIFYFFYNFAHQSKLLDNVIIFFAVYFPYVVIIAAGVFLLMHHEVFKADNTFQIFLQKKKEILLSFFAGGVAWVTATILKLFFQASRPFEVLPGVHALFSPTDYAFPSGHATFFSALAVSLSLSHKKAGYIFMIFAVMIGIARIVAGVHFPSDILGGFVLGTIVSCIINSILKKS